MTEQVIKQIKKALKNENVKVEAFYFDRANDELRVKVAYFVDKSSFADARIIPTPMAERTRETRDKIISVLRALSKNGLRPAYRTEQRENTDNYGTLDCRYIIFR